MSKKRSRYSGRTAVSIKRKRILPITLICVGAVLLTVAIAIGVGAYLRSKADAFEPKESWSFEENSSGDAESAGAVYAPMFEYGDSPFSFVKKGYTAVSAPLNYRDGSIAFDSAVCREYGREEYDASVSIAEYDAIFDENELKFCAYFNSTAFEMEDEGLRRVRRAYEISLIAEAVAGGVDDVLILGIEVNEENINEVASYMAELSSCVDVPVGIAISTGAVLQTQQNVYIAGRLESACDYVALDLRELAFYDDEGPQSIGEYLDPLRYYLSAYSLRLIFSSKNSELFDEVYDMGLKNAQIARTYP